jgi:hypothetical protein
MISATLKDSMKKALNPRKLIKPKKYVGLQQPTVKDLDKE